MTTPSPSVFQKQELVWKDEASFCEVASTFDTASPVFNLSFEPVATRSSSDKSLQKRLWESRPGYRGPREAILRFSMYAAGSIVDTATGSLVATGLQKLLAWALGGSDLTQVGGVAGAGATTTSFASATGTRTRGGLATVGIAGDTRAGGQAVVWGNPNTSILSAVEGAPNADDVLRAAMMAYLTESCGTSKRFLLNYTDGSDAAQYACHGCHCEMLRLVTVHGDLPYYEFTVRCAYWRVVSGIDTSAITLEDCDTCPSGGGSYVVQQVGTTTRRVLEATEFELTLNLGLAPWRGQGGGFGALQPVRNYIRTKGSPDEPAGTLRLTIPYDELEGTDWDKDGSDSTFYYLLAQFSVGEGTASTVGRHTTAFLPRMYRIGARPIVRNANGLRAADVMFAFREGTDTTSDLTKSAARFGQT